MKTIRANENNDLMFREELEKSKKKKKDEGLIDERVNIEESGGGDSTKGNPIEYFTD